MKVNLGALLAKRARLTPNIEAFVDIPSGRRLTFAQLNSCSNRFANELLEAGIQKGERVAVLLKNCPEFIGIMFGVAKVGAVFVPLNWRLVPEELAYIINDVGATRLFYGPEFSAVVSELRDTVQGGANIGYLQLRSEVQSFDAAQGFDTKPAVGLPVGPEVKACDEDMLFVMYTSGTSGAPKGVVHTHQTAFSGVLTLVGTADMRIRDRFLLATPLFHVAALIMAMSNVYRGITTVAMGEFDPVRAWHVIQEEKINFSVFAASMLTSMQQVPDIHIYDYSSLRWVISGASPVPITQILSYAAMNIEIHQAYGLTEACGVACIIDPERAASKVGSTGLPFIHTEVKVVKEDGTSVQPGESGEILVSGPHLMKEYWGMPEATKIAIQDSWLHTGDAATVDEEGCIYILDRIKDLIISGGENVSPAEIENVLLKHPLVGSVAVIGVKSKKWGESPLAVVIRRDESLNEADVLNHCRGKLAGYKLPKRCVFVDEIPTNASGKMLKRRLRDQFSHIEMD